MVTDCDRSLEAWLVTFLWQGCKVLTDIVRSRQVRDVEKLFIFLGYSEKS